jgi:hypothetical protein
MSKEIAGSFNDFLRIGKLLEEQANCAIPASHREIWGELVKNQLCEMTSGQNAKSPVIDSW